MPERMSPVGSIMWGVGRDAKLRMIVGNLLIVDRVPDRAELRSRLATAAAAVPRLRQRPDALPGIRPRPMWIDENPFESEHHIRNLAVPAPGDRRQVLDLLTLLETAPFDSNMSPWDVTVVEGLEGGRAALYLRAHHCLTDGLHGVSLIRSLLDHPTSASPSATSAAVASPPSDLSGLNGTAISNGSSPDLSSRRKPGTVSVTIDLAGAIHPFAHGVSAAMRIDPLDAALRTVQRGLDVASSVSRQVVVTGGRLSPFVPSQSMNTRFETFSVDGARKVALALGGSRNDLLVAGAATGLGLYHERLGVPRSELRLASPARWRSGAAGGGSVVPTRVEIPVGNDHPGPLFGVVAERLSRARHEPALHATELLASAISYLPTRVLVPALHSQAKSVDFVATSLPGIRGNRSICGAMIEESFPFGPRLGSLMNITGYGVDDRLDVGLGLDPIAISDPDMLVSCMQEAFQGFADAQGS